MPTRKIIKRRPTTANEPGVSLLGSLALHAAIIGATLLTWHHSLDMPTDQTPWIPVDLVTIAQKTNIAPTHVDTPPVKIPPPEQMTPPPVSLATAPVAPEVKPPQFEVAPDTAPVKPKPQTKKQLQQDLSDLLNDLTKPQSKKGKTAARTIEGAGDQTAMTADLSDALTSQIHRCWSPPTGVPKAGQMFVTVRLSLNSDGTVAQPPQSSADFDGPYQGAAIGAVERAIYACQPYRLPANRYSEWQHSTLVFDPRKPAGDQ